MSKCLISEVVRDISFPSLNPKHKIELGQNSVFHIAMIDCV